MTVIQRNFSLRNEMIPSNFLMRNRKREVMYRNQYFLDNTRDRSVKRKIKKETRERVLTKG